MDRSRRLHRRVRPRQKNAIKTPQRTKKLGDGLYVFYIDYPDDISIGEVLDNIANPPLEKLKSIADKLARQRKNIKRR